MTSSRGTRGAIVGVLAGLGSFRVLVALATSLSITAAVAGPMAIQAHQTRQELSEEATDFPDPTPPPADPDPTDSSPDPTTPNSTAPSTSPSSTQPGVTVTTSTAPTNPTPPSEPPIVTEPPVITEPPPPAPGRIAISLTDDFSESYEMDGFEVFGMVFLRLDVENASEVRFWIDDPSRAGDPMRVDSSAPFELADGGFDSATLSEGAHILTVEVDSGGDTTVTSASFFVIK